MKHITEEFTIKFGFKGRNRIIITARNHNDHVITTVGSGLTTNDMRSIGKFLLKTADIIDSDETFKNRN